MQFASRMIFYLQRRFMRRRTQWLQLVCLSSAILASTALAQDLNDPQQIIKAIEEMNWITEEYPPFNYRDHNTGKITGVGVDVLFEIFRRTGVELSREDLKIYPWARSYNLLLNEPGTALFSTTYTIERLQQMKFVGPMVPNIIAVIAPKSRDLTVTNAKDLNHLTIGVVRDDIGEQLLVTEGIDLSKVDRLNSGLSMVKKLAAGRVDAIAYAQVIAQNLFEQAGLNPNDFESIYILKESSMGYTFHIDTDARILEPMRKALDEIRVDGTLAQIHARYNL